MMLHGKRVLVVDGNRDIRNWFRQELTAQECLVDCAKNPTEALRMLNTEDRYDLITINYNLPRSDGIQMVEAIREGKFKFPILMYNANNHADRRRVEAAGIDQIPLPLTSKQFQHALSQVFN